MTFIREWIVPGLTTALVAWIFIPTIPAEPVSYDNLAVGQHRTCALEGRIMPSPRGWYPPEQFAPLIPSAGGTMRVIDAHECAGSMAFTHLIVEAAGGDKASILVTRSPEGGERTLRRRFRDFEVTQVRTTRRRAFIVVDWKQSRALRRWREATTERMRQFLRQSEGS